MKKKISCVLLSVVFALSLAGCKKEGPIPSGFYVEKTANGINYCEFCCSSEREIHVQTHCWEIDGNYVRCWVSSCDFWRAKIVEKDGEIYFEGYEWTPFLSTVKMGDKDIYQAVYDERTKCFTFTLVEKNRS